MFDTYIPERVGATFNTLAKQAPLLSWQGKVDGCRALLIHHDGKFVIHGRNISKVTDSYLDKSEHFAHIVDAFRGIKEDFVVDGEIYHRDGVQICAGIFNAGLDRAIEIQEKKGHCTFHLFDCLNWDGKDLRKVRYANREEYLDTEIMPKLGTSFEGLWWVWKVEEWGVTQGLAEALACKDKALAWAKAKGLEGIVVKDVNAPFAKRSCAKLKPFDTFDLVIMGYDNSTSATYAGNGIAALQLGLYIDGILKTVSRCSGMTDEQRRMFYEDGDKYIGSVVEVSAQAIAAKGGLRHPSFIRFRDDLLPEDQELNKYV